MTSLPSRWDWLSQAEVGTALRDARGAAKRSMHLA